MMRQIVSGVGAILLFFAIVALMCGGVGIVFTNTPRPLALGWLLLLSSLLLAAWSSKLWYRALPGIFSCGAMNGLMMTFSGHLIGQADKPVHQTEGLLLTGVFVALAALAVRAGERGGELDAFDQVMYAILVLFLGVAIIAVKSFAAQTIGLTGMLLAMGSVVIRKRRRMGLSSTTGS